MAVYKVGPVAFSGTAVRTVVALAMAVGVTSSLGTFAAGGEHTPENAEPVATEMATPAPMVSPVAQPPQP